MKYSAEEYRQINEFDYFAGGVPAGVIFQQNIEKLKRIVAAPNIKPAEVCLVGLVSYFEAFFKDHFAAIVNIQPKIVENLKKAGLNTDVDVLDIVSLGDRSEIRLGSLLAEKYDFGTAKRINSIYQSLLKITPFSKDEISQFDQLLNDRNLIVHHGGIFTLKYVKQKFGSKTGDAFDNSLDVTPETFWLALLFCETIVEKTITSTKKSLEIYISKNDVVQSEANKQALGLLDLWIDETWLDESNDDEYV